MATKTIKEAEDNSLGATMYQGKTLAQWEKEFDGEFTVRQLFQLLRSGVDLGRIKLGLVDEDGDICNDPLFKDEEFFFEKKDNVNETIDEEAALDEANPRAFYNALKVMDIKPEDVVTVGDFIKLLKRKTSLDDRIVFRSPDKKECMLFDVQSKAGVAIVDIVAKKTVDEADSQTSEKEKEDNMNEGHKSWYGGGYGGTGSSYSRLGSRAPRGAEIGWYSVEQLDPKAKGKMPGWRCGPSNFPFEDLLYPERKYVKGAMVMRNKYLKAGEMSGEKYIAIPSYFDAIKNNDQEAINLLNALGIPLDLTFGMDPNEDYSNSYVVKA